MKLTTASPEPPEKVRPAVFRYRRDLDGHMRRFRVSGFGFRVRSAKFGASEHENLEAGTRNPELAQSQPFVNPSIRYAYIDS